MNFWLRLLTFSLPAGKVMGIPLRINWLLLVFLPFYVFSMVQGSGSLPRSVWLTQFALSIGAMLILYGSILLHELGHAWGMRLVGESCDEIHLTPLGGIAIGGGGNTSPRSELIVVGLGPAVSLALAVSGFALQFLWSSSVGSSSLWSFGIWAMFMSIGSINMGLFLFNMLLPVFPLDSSKIVRALFSLWFNPQRVTYYVANIGMGICVFLILASLTGLRVPFLGNIGGLLILIVLMGFQACQYELQALQADNVYRTYHGWSDKPVYFDSEMTARALRLAKQDLGWLGKLLAGPKDSRPVFKGVPKVTRPPAVRPAVFSPPKKTGSVRIMTGVEPEKLTDPVEIRALMEAAAEAEDFPLAARLKRRLRELTG